jgi:hypothetical protein
MSLFALRVLRRTFAGAAKAEPVTTGLCFDLTPEQKEIQQLARQVREKRGGEEASAADLTLVARVQFAREEIMPKAAHHDKTGEYPCAKQFRFGSDWA